MKLCVPVFGPLTADRQEAWEATQAWWARRGVQLVVGTMPSRAAARNAAAEQVDGDVLLFGDADTVVPLAQLEQAATLARAQDSFVIAFDVLHRLQRGANFEHVALRPKGYRVLDSSNGVVAVSRRLWEEVGGFDERFTCWGGEDRAFMHACLTFREQAQPLRVKGFALHHWHRPPREAREPAKLPLGLALRYKQFAGREPREGPLTRLPGAVRDRAALERLLREPGGPRADVR